MAERIKILTTEIPRDAGILYFLKSNEEGYLEIWATLLNRSGNIPLKERRKNKDKTEKTEPEIQSDNNPQP